MRITMKELIEYYKELQKNVQYCCYCIELKNDAISCCQENHFVDFQDLDDDTQLDIITEMINAEAKL